MAEGLESFHGVYLLYCQEDEQFMKIRRAFIGYTKNQNVLNHQKFEKIGRAIKPSILGPWEMVLIIYGFPNSALALSFEQTWRHSRTAKRLQHLTPKGITERGYDYCIRILSEMINVGPWNRLSLNVQWFNETYRFYFHLVCKCPLKHMPITCEGQVVLKSNADNQSLDEYFKNKICVLCAQQWSQIDHLHCLDPTCGAVTHIVCLSRHFLGSRDHTIPIDGNCPVCGIHALWGDLIRKRNECYKC